jgi:hypothetical protein
MRSAYSQHYEDEEEPKNEAVKSRVKRERSNHLSTTGAVDPRCRTDAFGACKAADADSRPTCHRLPLAG